VDLFDRVDPSSATERVHFMKRHLKSIIVFLSLAVALILTVTYKGPPGPAGLKVGAGEPLGAAKVDKRPYDLVALRVFNSVLMRINDSYVDPTRVDPRQMLLSSLDQVQKSVAEVLIEHKTGQNKVVVKVDTAQQEFDIANVDSPWSLWKKMQEVFKFVSANLPKDSDPETVRSIEYAATNGMLSTLDPHSVLLDPQNYNEMKLNTRGSFGGLGIVIGIRKGHLTVIRPIPDTPAARAGIKAGDHIVRIDKLSTVNMMLNDAVNRLRGDPDTKVEVWVERPGKDAKAAESRRVVLTRAVIKVKTVEARMLKNNVGYVKLFNSFGGNTADELRRGLDDLKKKGMKALVFDLRANPGGLLDQAIKVADEFLDSGTIVTTVGYANKQREEKRASPGNQPHVPMAVLVNHGSASASEIVAGALKNLDRAVVIGTKTFGKGSVQVLYDMEDGSALKLTIAQYLTPGDVSIQSVGITPDVLLDKVAVDKDKGVWLFREYKGMSEGELEAHLESRNVAAEDKPVETIKFLVPEPPKKVAKRDNEDDPLAGSGEEDDEPEEDFEAASDPEKANDYEVLFARDLVAQAKGWRRREVLSSSRGFFEKKRAEEEARVVEALKKVGIDWTPVGAGPTPQLTVTASTDRPDNAVPAGETIKFKVTVTNKGPGTAGQVRAVLQSSDFLFDQREFVFGKMKPGESKSYLVPVKVPKDALSRVDPLKLQVYEEHGAKAQLEDELRVAIRGAERPLFAYSYQLIDDIKGNSDGLVQRGESVRLHVTVKNIGVGKSTETLAQLRNLSDEGLDIIKGRFNVDNMAPGDTKSIDFVFDVSQEYKPDDFRVELSVYDAVLHEYVTDKLTFPVSQAQPAQAASGLVSPKRDGVDIVGSPSKDAPVVAQAPKAASFKLTGETGDFYRIELEAGRPAFLAKSVAERAGGGEAKATFTPHLQVSPPRITLGQSPLLVEGNTFRLNGKALDDNQVADVFVFVSNRTGKIDRKKVFYRSNRKGQKPGELGFDAEIPLWPGPNVVTVVARENLQVQSQQTLVVERAQTAVAQGEGKGKGKTP
jgi:carboxyl-terminal processing protease